ncbi:hypothetical protein CMI47_05510 [Candidatus Pacearchaeota archaeon]|jgi:hypothetical protein|nr:hypothetical protein [Candidatus Pacearchaeota archaeon]|tara:strand:+ start:4759 stop:5301 length:543 start_codon:yes stop_codon:yes gene_type:complete
MTYNLRRLTPIAGEDVLPLADAKLSAHITSDDEDTVLAGFRDAALSEVEKLSGYAVDGGQFVWEQPRFGRHNVLPVRGATSIDSVAYMGTDGVSASYADARLVNGAAYPAVGGSWPTAYGSAAITFTVDAAPADKLALLIIAAQLKFQVFENRGRDDAKYIEGIEMAIASTLNSIRGDAL